MSPRIGKKTPKNGNQCKFLNFKVTHFKKIKGVGARLKNDLSQKKLFCLRGSGDMREKPRLSKMGPVSPMYQVLDFGGRRRLSNFPRAFYSQIYV
jgi:hypothetical protein